MSNLIGIDIGARFVKVVTIEAKKKLSLTNIFMFPVPYLKDSPEKIDLDEFYNRFVSNISVDALKKSLIGVNIPSSLVTVMILRLPKMTKKELGIAVITEAKRKIVPAPDINSVFRYLVLDEVTAAKENITMYEVLAVKTQKDYSDEIIKLFNMFGGISLSFISPTCYTIANLFPPTHEIYQKDTAFIDIGYDSIDITIARKGKLYFYRNIKFGLKDVIFHMSTTLNVPLSEIEKVIEDKGIPDIQIDIKDKVRLAEEIMCQKYEASLRQVQPEVNSLELRMLWNTEIERIINEIRRTLIYYKEYTAGGRVENLLFLGGATTIKGFFSIVAKGIGGDCLQVSPFTNMDICVDEKQSVYAKELFSLFVPAVSIALSIPLAIKEEAIIDFLPIELKRQKIVVRRQIVLIIIGIILFSFAFLFWLTSLLEKQMLKDSLNRLDFELGRKKVFIDMLNDIKKEKTILEERLKGVGDILSQRLDMPSILAELVLLTPKKVILTDVDISVKGKESSLGSEFPAQLPLQQQDEFAPTPEGHMADDRPKADGHKAVFPAQETKSADNRPKISITASCFADYEETEELAELFKSNLEKSTYFVDVKLISPELEKITPLIEGSVSVSLTEPKDREFSLEAGLK